MKKHFNAGDIVTFRIEGVPAYRIEEEIYYGIVLYSNDSEYCVKYFNVRDYDLAELAHVKDIYKYSYEYFHEQNIVKI
jgi:hypothetical protein